MTTQAQYLVAKHIPQVERNEPRNFGIILWTPWGVTSRFIGQYGQDIDGRKFPDWVVDGEVMKEWIYYWQNAIKKKRALSPKKSAVTDESPDFLEVLSESNSGNFILSDRSFVVDDITKEDIPALTKYLFSILVEMGEDKQTAKASFDIEKECNRILKDVHRTRHPHLKREQSVIVPLANGTNDILDFDYWVGNGTPKKLYQRLPITRRINEVGHSIAWQFQQVQRVKLIDREDGAALVMPTEEQRCSEDYKRAIAVLSTETRVIDLSTSRDFFIEEIERALPRPIEQRTLD